LFIGGADPRSGDFAGIGREEAAVPRRASDGELFADVLHLRIERWLEQEGMLDAAGFWGASRRRARNSELRRRGGTRRVV
jgi:hypothetical protein